MFSIWQHFPSDCPSSPDCCQELCAISAVLFSELPLLKGHLQRTADVSRQDLEAVLPSGCFTQEYDGFFLADSLLTALNYTEEAEEKGKRGVE